MIGRYARNLLREELGGKIEGGEDDLVVGAAEFGDDDDDDYGVSDCS